MDERRPPEKHWWEAWMIIINSWINLALYPVERYRLIWKLHLHTLLSKHQHFQNAKAHWETMFRCLSHWKLKREWYLFYTSTMSVQTCKSITRTDSLLNVSVSRQVWEDQGINLKKNKGITDNIIFYSFFKWQLNPQGLKEQSLSYHNKFLYPNMSFPVQQYLSRAFHREKADQKQAQKQQVKSCIR